MDSQNWFLDAISSNPCWTHTFYFFLFWTHTFSGDKRESFWLAIFYFNYWKASEKKPAKRELIFSLLLFIFPSYSNVSHFIIQDFSLKHTSNIFYLKTQLFELIFWLRQEVKMCIFCKLRRLNNLEIIIGFNMKMHL